MTDDIEDVRRDQEPNGSTWGEAKAEHAAAVGDESFSGTYKPGDRVRVTYNSNGVWFETVVSDSGWFYSKHTIEHIGFDEVTIEVLDSPAGSVPLPTPTTTGEDRGSWREKLAAKLYRCPPAPFSSQDNDDAVQNAYEDADSVMPVADELLAEIEQLRERVRIQHGINEDWVKYGQRVSAKRQSDVEEFESALGLEHAGRGYHYERMISAAQGVRSERDEALAELATTREERDKAVADLAFERDPGKTGSLKSNAGLIAYMAQPGSALDAVKQLRQQEAELAKQNETEFDYGYRSAYERICDWLEHEFQPTPAAGSPVPEEPTGQAAANRSPLPGDPFEPYRGYRPGDPVSSPRPKEPTATPKQRGHLVSYRVDNHWEGECLGCKWTATGGGEQVVQGMYDAHDCDDFPADPQAGA